MENKKYESPKFEFQEMKLMERVAAKCWGYDEAWYDLNNDDKIDGSDFRIDFTSIIGLGETGCQGQNAANALNEWAKDKGIPLNSVASDCATKNSRYSISPS